MPKPKVSFTVDGKAFNENSIGGIVEAVSRRLDKLPFGTLLSTKELAMRVGFTDSGIVTKASKLAGYWVRYGNRSIWGSKATIMAAKERLSGN